MLQERKEEMPEVQKVGDQDERKAEGTIFYGSRGFFTDFLRIFTDLTDFYGSHGFLRISRIFTDLTDFYGSNGFSRFFHGFFTDLMVFHGYFTDFWRFWGVYMFLWIFSHVT
jgi:hypothetical protein